MTGAEVLARATRALSAAGIADAGRDARRLLAHVLKVPHGRLTLFLPEPVQPDLEVIYNVMIERRCERVPVSHLTGRRQFYGREFLVTPEVLDPRPETETLIEAALSAPYTRVLDLGTGSGCIVLTLVAERDGAKGHGTDLSDAALNVAYWNRNAMRLEAQVSLQQGSWFAAVDEGATYDLIVSNPPYIAALEMDGLAAEVVDHEPHVALTDGADGLTAYRAIGEGLITHLAPGGRVLLEIGPTQGAAVTAILEGAGLGEIRVIPDLDGRDRVVQATRTGG